MYLQNKYTKWYNSIIDRARNRTIDEYTESHHIIPACLGGSNKSENKVRLTYREHRLCHLLLPFMVENKLKGKMWHAAKGVLISNNPNHKRTESKSRLAEKARIEAVNSRKGVPRSQETIEKIKLTKLLNPPHKQIVSEETKKKLSIARKGKPHSAEHNRKVSEALKALPGKKWTAESKLKMSISSSKPKKKATCPHCGKTGSQNGLTRYHFDKCKQSTI